MKTTTNTNTQVRAIWNGTEYAVADLGWWSDCGNVWHGFESDQDLFDGCAILLVGGPRDGEVVA